jgi:hypothetical protein
MDVPGVFVLPSFYDGIFQLFLEIFVEKIHCKLVKIPPVLPFSKRGEEAENSFCRELLPNFRF